MSFIIIPDEITTDRELSRFSKVLFWEIMSLAQKDGICYASSTYFISKFNTSRSKVFRAVEELKSRWFIQWWLKKITISESIKETIDSKELRKKANSVNSDTVTVSNLTPHSVNSDTVQSQIWHPPIYSIINNLINNLIEGKKIEKKPSENLIQAFCDFYEYREQAWKKDKKMLPTDKSMEVLIKSMCKEKYEAIAIRKIERAIENWRRGANYDLDPKEKQRIIEQERSKPALSTPHRTWWATVTLAY